MTDHQGKLFTIAILKGPPKSPFCDSVDLEPERLYCILTRHRIQPEEEPVLDEEF